MGSAKLIWFAANAPAPHAFDEPTVCRNAIWLDVKAEEDRRNDSTRTDSARQEGMPDVIVQWTCGAVPMPSMSQAEFGADKLVGRMNLLSLVIGLQGLVTPYWSGEPDHVVHILTMANVFLLYMPPGNGEAMVHYQDTIKQRVALSRISPHIGKDLHANLRSIFGLSSIAVWGSAGGPKNRSNYERMSPGDDILIVEGDAIRLIGKIAAKVESRSLSSELWRPLRGNGISSWELIYFIASPRELDVPFVEFCSLFGYAKNFRLRGFTPVAPARLEEFYTKYDDLYSILVRIERGQPVEQKIATLSTAADAAPDLIEVSPEELVEALKQPAVSEHVRMQWKLALLGLKAGERVWVPVGDQARLRQTYEFDSFDDEFAAGIDLPHSYIENIDVVWKQEFRIGAAYEIENSTSIYSGLLRFADLNIIAPNTLYPMFIVAPKEKKGRLREQLRRPTFRRLELDKKVRFLSYEAIDEIDRFFSGSSSGMSVDLILSKSEQAA